MTPIVETDYPCPVVTNGEIAATNLESACRRAWACFAQDPILPAVAETLVDMERLKAQFLGDLDALDRLEALALQFKDVEGSFRAPLIQAEAASAVHRFEDARAHLMRAALMGAPGEDIERHLLKINQACGVKLDDVLDTRRRIAAASPRLEQMVPLGAVLADLERFDEAGRSRISISPRFWYRRAIAYVPACVKARVHLAEVCAGQDQLAEAEALLMPVLASRDPEARWRLADVLTAQGRFKEAEAHLDVARRGFDGLLAKHLLAFADHAAEFYAGSGNDYRRPTRRAVKQQERKNGPYS